MLLGIGVSLRPDFGFVISDFGNPKPLIQSGNGKCADFGFAISASKSSSFMAPSANVPISDFGTGFDLRFRQVTAPVS
jgi:hypothetical protein